MAKVTIAIGSALIVLGIVAFAATGATHYTALIPCAFGALIELCGALALNPAARKHAMHVASMLAVLGIVAPLVRMVPAMARGHIDPPAFYSQLVMVVLCAALLVLCVRSFINARRERLAARP